MRYTTFYKYLIVLYRILSVFSFHYKFKIQFLNDLPLYSKTVQTSGRIRVPTMFSVLVPLKPISGFVMEQYSIQFSTRAEPCLVLLCTLL